MAIKHLSLSQTVRQVAAAMSNYSKKQKLVSVVVIPSLIVGMLLTTTSIQAQEVKPPPPSTDHAYQPSAYGKPVDFANIDFSEGAPAFEGTYVVAEDKLTNAECGGPYLDDECYQRYGVPIPKEVAFNAKDKDGNYTYKGLRPPTAEQMKAAQPDSFPDIPNPNPELTITPTKEAGLQVRPYYGDSGHTTQGFLMPWIYPHAGLFMSQSSPNWALSGGTFEYYFFSPAAYPGDGCLESVMQHNMGQFGVVTHQHAYYNHCALNTGWQFHDQSFGGWEAHNAAWIARYERPQQGGSTYKEYLWVYDKTGDAIGPWWQSCTQAAIFNYDTGVWEQKWNVCGWQNQYAVGDAWDIFESLYIYQPRSGGWQCQLNPSVVHMSNQIFYYNSNNQWAALVNVSPYDNIHSHCGTWNFGNTFDPNGLLGEIRF